MTKTVEQIYKEYINLIRRKSWYFSKKWDIDFEEVFSQANEIFMSAYNTYDSNKSSFSTHLYISLDRLDYWSKQEVKFRYLNVYLTEFQPDTFPKILQEQVDFYNAMGELSKDARQLLENALTGLYEAKGTDAVPHDKTDYTRISRTLGLYCISKINKSLFSWPAKRTKVAFSEISFWYKKNFVF